MILGFKPQFVPKILDGTKLHTIRSGNRWKPGMSIQMATGVRTPQYNQFNADRPDLQVCKGVQDIVIRFNCKDDFFVLQNMKTNSIYTFSIFIDCKQIKNQFAISRLAANDGFEYTWQFLEWFFAARSKANNRFIGQLIHWTENNSY